MTIQMKLLEQYFHKAQFIYFVVLTFESVDETLWCDHCYSGETSSMVLSHHAFVFDHLANKCSLEISSRFDFKEQKGLSNFQNNQHVPKNVFQT